jgi:starvation-inducible DNA-binding protein
VAAPSQLDRLSSARVPEATIHDARAQLESLVADHDRICRALRDDSRRADEAGDPATADLLNEVTQAFDKHRWMLRAVLDDHMLD